ncbi:hypothetical protein D3C75_777410 [compost metagenome]
MIHCIAEQVNQRIPDFLNHGPVQLGFHSVQHQLNLLAQLLGEIPDRSREPLEQMPDGQHPRLHHTILQLSHRSGDMIRNIPQPLHKLLIAVGARNGLLQLRQ